MRLSMFAASVLAACGGSGSHPGTSPDAAGPDASPQAASCTSSGPPRGAVFAIGGSAPEVRVMTLADGQLVDHGFHFTGIQDPQFVTMRADGAEAVIAWGGYGVPYGIVAVTLTPDGTTATIGTPLQLGTDLTPEGIAYVSSDRIVLAASGPTHQVITLDRGAGGFAETTRTPAPGHFPVQLVRRPGTAQAIMARVEFGVDTTTSVYALGANASGKFTALGSVGSIAPPTISIGVHPNGGLVYSAADNPADPLSPTHLEATGLIHVLAVSDAGLVDQPMAPLAKLSDTLTVDPNGGMLVLSSPVYEIDPANGEPTVRSYVLQTVPLDAQGTPGIALAPTAPITGLLFNDFHLAPSGHLVDALELDPFSVPDAQAHPLEVRFQSAPGQWDVCQSVMLPGAAHFALAP